MGSSQPDGGGVSPPRPPECEGRNGEDARQANPRQERQVCVGCGAIEGQLHEWECEYEECPLCGRDIWGPCFCADRHFGLSDDRDLTDEEEALWLTSLGEVGRVPYLNWPLLCAYCGERFPEFFIVPNKEWRYYIPKGHRKDVICEGCYEQIKEKIDKAQQEAPKYREIPFPATAARELYKLMYHLRSVTSLVYVMSRFDESLTPPDLSLLDEIDYRITVWVKKLQKRFAVRDQHEAKRED